MPRRPRWYQAHRPSCETQSTVDRQFLFKPDPVIRDIIGSAAGRALRKYPVKLYWLDFNINHRQSGRAPLSDHPKHIENMVKFDRLFSSILARELNRYLGREGPIYSTRNRGDAAVDDGGLEQQLLYAVTNVVKDGLVDRVAHWKGVSSYGQLAHGRVDRYPYINRTAWHRAGGARGKRPPEAFVEWVEVRLTSLPSWSGLSADRRQALFRRRVRELEGAFRAEREREGRRVMGKARLAKVDPRGRPRRRRVRTPMPVCHAASAEAAREYKKQLRDFLDWYFRASGAYLRGDYYAVFPRGSFRPPLIQAVE